MLVRDVITMVTVRHEKVSDYNGIANLNYSSFVAKRPYSYKSEPLIAAVLRHSQHFDPELSLVAELEGRVVGHALFSPFEFIVLGQKRRGVFLAPLAVDTRLQGHGIGSQLMDAGHRVATEKGFALSVLCGIPEYYPRFGYMQKAFAHTGATIEMGEGNTDLEGISERPVMQADLPWILNMWQNDHEHDRLAWFPGEEISQWFNHSLVYRSSVILRGGTRIAYVKYKCQPYLRINELLTEEGAASTVLSYLRREHPTQDKGIIAFSMREESLREKLSDCPYTRLRRDIRTSDALMLKVLDAKDELLLRYCAEAKIDELNLGVLAFPTLLDIDN